MRAPAARAAVLAAILTLSLPVSAGWWEVWREDMRFELGAARDQALAAVAEDPSSADAVAAAMWWLTNIENLPAPEEILSVSENGRDPELGFVLGLIETRLRSERRRRAFSRRPSWRGRSEFSAPSTWSVTWCRRTMDCRRLDPGG